MAVHASHAALPYCIKGARYSVLVPMLDASGTPTAATTPDTEISEDNAAATDAAEEISATSGMDGMALMTFTGAETDSSLLAAHFKSASGPKATLMVLTPAVLAEVGTGTLSAGSAGGGTLGTLLAYDVTGCFVKTTGGTGGGGTGGANNQARKIITYNTGSGAFTVAPNWETTPSTDTTYAVLLPEGVTLGMLKALNPTTAGRTLDVSSGGEAGVDWANVGSPTTTLNLSGTTVGTVAALASGSITAAVIATGAIDADAIADNAIDAGAIAADAITAAKIAAGAIDAATFAADTGLKPINTGTVTASGTTSTTAVLASGNGSVQNYYRDCLLRITGGTGADQAPRLITQYDFDTKTATVTPAFVTTPDGTSTYAVLPAGPTVLRAWLAVVPSALISGRVDSDLGAVSTDATAANNLESYLDGTLFMPVDPFSTKWAISGTTLTVKQPDGTTTAYTRTLTTVPDASADDITASN